MKKRKARPSRAKSPKSFQEFIKEIDLPLLYEQKAILLKAQDTMTGLINFLDCFQDFLVDHCGVPGNEVFPPCELR